MQSSGDRTAPRFGSIRRKGLSRTRTMSQPYQGGDCMADVGALEEAIKAARATAEPGMNEATTLYRVIDPLIRAMGYQPQEVALEDTSGIAQRPDRVLLRGSEAEWYLEA